MLANFCSGKSNSWTREGLHAIKGVQSVKIQELDLGGFMHATRGVVVGVQLRIGYGRGVPLRRCNAKSAMKEMQMRECSCRSATKVAQLKECNEGVPLMECIQGTVQQGQLYHSCIDNNDRWSSLKPMKN
eukprot:1157358-Pelagomonas_calceolata.AAC.14